MGTKTETNSQNNQSTIAPVNFQIFYGYNEKGISNEQENFNAFVDGINEIISRNGDVQIEKLKENSREGLGQRYDWDVVTEQYLSVFEKLLGNSPDSNE